MAVGLRASRLGSRARRLGAHSSPDTAQLARRPGRTVRPSITSPGSTRAAESFVTVADSIMSKLCDEPRHVTNPNTLIGGYFAADLPDISPDDQRPIDNTGRKLGTNSFSWRGVLFSRPSSWQRTSALQLSEEMGRVRYSVRAADTGEGISVCLVLQLEESLRPAYRRIHIEQAWRLVSMLGESDDDRGPEAQVLSSIQASDDEHEVLSSVQVSADRNMVLVGRVERGTGAKKVFMYVSELRREGEGEECFRWRLTSVDALS
mmetsp:Transcript_8614/g.23373  ORF Transcript_8614/g.23373 Transcript_8614/m.23373 type:complete len:262 (-) Transcript_8614:48-833(-)